MTQAHGRIAQASLEAKAATAAEVAEASIATLLAPVAGIDGFGPAMTRRLPLHVDRDVPRWIDLLWFVPRAWLDTRPVAAPREHIGRTVAVDIEVRGYRQARSPRAPFVVEASVGSEGLDLVFFQGRADWHKQRFPIGLAARVLGRLGERDGRLQLPHPQLLSGGGGEASPIYPAIAGLPPLRLLRAITAALDRLPDLALRLPPPAMTNAWPGWSAAMAALHREPKADLRELARQRLAMDELFVLQLRLQAERARRQAVTTRRIESDGAMGRELLAELGFVPTADQLQAAGEIIADLARPSPMARLLQGDVGSGKTLVAMLAMLTVVEAGRQAALLAPTEILARQHETTLGVWAAKLGLRVGCLTGGMQAGERRALLAGFATGSIRVVIGTHALFQDDVAFADLALVVIDEQQRFGVRQRQALLAKGSDPHLLLMSATPIPRSLLLALYGDLATSSLRQKPAGRLPVDTRLIAARRLAEVVAACARALEGGALIYWICPEVGSDEAAEEAADAAANQRYEALARRFGPLVALAHGRQTAAERAQSLASFATGARRLLVATTVVEVGVDVPAANVMVIEGAERFGLAQLHQLRGRIGRGGGTATCLLVYGEPARETALERLQILRGTDDGFAIAEADLAMRGPGDVAGARQSGLLNFRFADLARDRDLLVRARRAAEALIRRDPELRTNRGRAAHQLLLLHEATIPASIGAG